MRGFTTVDGRYYETDNGPCSPDDREVPLRPSGERAGRDEPDSWRNPRNTDDLHADKVVFGVREVATILSVAVMGVSLYFALGSRLDVQSVQIQSIKEAQAANTATIHMEIEDLKKRLDSHEARSFGKEGRY